MKSRKESPREKTIDHDIILYIYILIEDIKEIEIHETCHKFDRAFDIFSPRCRTRKVYFPFSRDRTIQPDRSVPFNDRRKKERKKEKKVGKKRETFATWNVARYNDRDREKRRIKSITDPSSSIGAREG